MIELNPVFYRINVVNVISEYIIKVSTKTSVLNLRWVIGFWLRTNCIRNTSSKGSLCACIQIFYPVRPLTFRGKYEL